jgi:calcium-dependent protein kinase
MTLTHRALRKPRGTAYYVAPEVMRFEYGPEADMWSVGVIAYLLLSGKVPFHGDTETEILQQVMAGKKIDFESGPWVRVSHQAKDFLKKILERDVGLRHTAVQALNHPWLRGEASGEFEIDAAAVSSLHAFSKYGRMRKLALRAIAGVISDSRVIEDLRLQFETMDENDNNLISTSELQTALKKTTWKHTDHEIKELLESIHCYTYGPFRNESTGAKIDYHEFLAATMSVRQLEKYIQDKEHFNMVLRKAFNFFDKDGDGLISSDDLRKCLSSDRGNVDSLVEECMEEADLTNSGSINFESFVRLLHIHDPSSRSRYGYVKTPSSSAN